MSFGASPSDIIIVVTFCRALYRKCRDAGGEYDEISREVRGLHTVLKHLKYEVEASESPLNRDRSLWGRQLAPIIGDCDFTLKQLDGLLQKYGRLSNGGSSPSSPRILWDKVRFGSSEMDTLGTIRVKLISHKTSLTLLLDTIQLHQSGKMATTLDNHGGQLDVILDKVDSIAARMGQKSGSILTTYDDDDKEVWKQFRRELVAEGFSSDVLTQHKDVLRAYIREVDQQGLLDEMPTQPLPPAQQQPPGVNPQHWLDNVHSPPPPSEGPPPSFESLNTPTDDGSAKEMMVREENMKFPQSMKFERRKPEERHIDLQRQLDGLNLSRDISEFTPRTTPAVPKLISSDEKDEKDIQYFNTDGSSDEDSESEDSLKRPKAPQMGLVIRTSDLFKSNQGLKLLLPSSPTSFRSSQGSVGEEYAMRSIAVRPKNTGEFGSSPSRPGAIPIPSANPRSSDERFGTSPREPIRLAPDEHGNGIPPDAKWTRISRHLVSPEVLDQDHRRYEARPEWVAVLGILSRAEIESYASRSAEIRAARRRRSHAAPPFPKETPPPQPPRPVPVPIPCTNSNPHRNHDSSSTSDSESSDSSHHHHHRNRNRNRAPRTNSNLHSNHDSSSTSDSESSDSSHHHHRNRNRNRAPHSYTPSDINVPVFGYPNPIGQPLPSQNQNQGPPSSNRSQANSMPQPIWMATPPPNISSGGIWVPASQGQGGVYYPPKEKERKRHRSSRRHYSHSHSSNSKGGRERDRDRDRERKAPPSQKVSRWKENLTAASIGGAAVSLLNVLTEAAEGL